MIHRPFDRILASRMLAKVVEYIDEHCTTTAANPPAVGIGQVSGEMRMTPLEDIMRMVDETVQRPREQWWMRLRPIARMMAHPLPHPQTPAEEASITYAQREH